MSFLLNPYRFGSVAFPTIASLYARYRADLGITISTGVSNWADQSGNSRDLSQGTGGNQPTLVSAGFNGYDYIQFDGSNDFLSRVQALVQPIHVFIAFIADTWTASDAVISFRDASSDPSDLRVAQVTSTPQIKQIGSSTGNTVSPTLGSRYLLQSFFSGASSFQALNNDAAVTGTTVNNDATHFILGASGLGGGNAGDINVAELVIFNAEVTGADLTALKTYFNSRYALW